MENKTEEFNHGAIHQPLRRGLKKVVRRMQGRRLGKGMGVDWTKGSQFRPILRGKIPIKNQAQNYSCGGQTGAYFLEIQRIIQGIQEGELSAKSVYAPIAYPGGGTSTDMLEKQLGGDGANLEKEVPSYDIYGNPLPETSMIEKSWVTPELSLSALSRAGYVPYDVNDDIESIAEAIDTYGAVMWKIAGQNGNIPDWRSATPQPPNKYNKNPLWYHFMCAYDFEIDPVTGNKRIVALQSEGEDWGDKGTQYFYEPYFNGSYIDAFTMIYGKNISPDPGNKTFWADVLRWFKTYWRLTP